MYSILKQVLSVDDLTQIRAMISEGSFIDGRATSVLQSKNNLQLPMGSEVARAVGAFARERLRTHALFKLAVQPMVVHPPLVSRYCEGMEYPDHVDVALMAGMRTDVAVTIFLNELESYDGGELVIDSGNGTRRYRLAAGDAIAYPASTVHHVSRVTRGERLCVVTWVQSRVRDPAKRQILFDLGTSSERLVDTACGARLSRSYWNLMRLWADASPGVDFD